MLFCLRHVSRICYLCLHSLVFFCNFGAYYLCRRVTGYGTSTRRKIISFFLSVYFQVDYSLSCGESHIFEQQPMFHTGECQMCNN